MRRFALLALLALPGAVASQGIADEPGIHGYVLAPGDTPVSGGTVVSFAFAASASTSIDRSGRFRIAVERGGVYSVTVNVPGFAPYQFRATVPASRTLRLPVIHLAPATYFRARFVTPAGEPILSPVIRRRSFDGSGVPIVDAPDAVTMEVDADGTARIGPLPHGITALAVDTPAGAQTRLPNVSVNGVNALLDGGTIVIQPGSTLQVDLFDASGMPVPDHYVLLEDVVPLSPLQFLPVRTNAEGRAIFERLGPGRYRVRTAASERCGTQDLSIVQTVAASGTGSVKTRIFLAGKATFRISSPVGPVHGAVVTARPDNPAPAIPGPMMMMGRGLPSPVAIALNTTRCRGTTDADGRVALASFPPGPSDLAVHFASSLYVRRLTVPIGGSEIAVSVPDGVLPVRIISGVTHEPVPQAFITWTVEGGGRSEATATIVGEALLEGVGTKAGILTVAARGFQPAEERLAEPPGVIHDVPLVPMPDTSLSVRVVTASGDALPNAVVEVFPANPLATPQLAVTNARGVVTFSDVPPGGLRVTAIANGYVASMMRVSQDRTGTVLTLSPGHRASISVELPATTGPLVARVLNSVGQTMDALLDGASDRGIEPPGRLSLGPLPPGEYAIELRGAGEHRQGRFTIAENDVAVTVR